MFRLSALILICLHFAAAQGQEKVGQPLLQAHSHNDYEHRRPLMDALAHGFTSVEADIHLVNGQLLVAHDPEQVNAERTLNSLYLEPLSKLASTNTSIFQTPITLTLLVDIKTDAQATYSALEPILEHYGSILTRFGPEGIETNAVTVILSGNRPRQTLAGQKMRFAAFDGRIADLGQGHPVSFMPLVSDNWKSHFKWNGEGQIPPAERTKLRDLVKQAHAEKRRIRFWATPDRKEAWQELQAAEVDLINTDDLSGLAKFLSPD